MNRENGDVVLVTGATGFVALHIIKLLQSEGYRVRGTVRSLKNENKLKPLRNLCPEAKHPLELVEADLTKDDGWEEAVKGCTYCLHVASPFPSTMPKKEEDLIIPAVEGTKRVLKACADAGTFKRVVLTSSIAAVHGEYPSDKDRIYTEEDWTDLSKDMDPYVKSKTMAEKAAWDFVASLPPNRKFELSTVNPGLIFGPCIGDEVSTSLSMIHRMMSILTMPMVPRIQMSICDVRDVALAHLHAMTIPEAGNNRHLINSGHMWYPDVAKVLHEEFGPLGYCIPKWTAPYIGVYLSSFVDSSATLVLPLIGRTCVFSNRRMVEVLKVEPHNLKDIILETAHSLIECGAIKKTRQYTRSKI